MKPILILIFFFTSVNLTFCQSQMELALEAEEQYRKADQKLNSVYQKILRDYSEDKEFIENLRISEKIWIQFRDAEMLMKYPENSYIREVSVFNLCYLGYLTKLTLQRVNTLQQWVDGHPEGEVCGGSVHVRE